MISQEKLNKVGERWSAMEQRKTREYVRQHGSYYGSVGGAKVPGGPFRFVHFCYEIERSQRIAGNFALHCIRVELALASPLSRFIDSLAA